MQRLFKRGNYDVYVVDSAFDPLVERLGLIDVTNDPTHAEIARSRGVGIGIKGSPTIRDRIVIIEDPQPKVEPVAVTITIESNVTPPDDDGPIEFHTPEPEPVKETPVFFEPPKKGVRKKAAPKVEDPLSAALKDVGQIVKKKGDVQNTHVKLVHGFVCAHSGLMTIGLPFGFQFDTVVNHQQLVDARKHAGDEFAATQLDDGSLSVVAGDLVMRVASGPSALWSMPNPDPNIAPATDRLRTALVEAATFASDSLARPEIAGLMLQAGSVVGTDAQGMVEAWHGIDMPPNQRIPVAFAKLLSKIKRPIVGFGFSDTSFTVWFGDGGFVRTIKHQPTYCNWQNAITVADDTAVSMKLPDSFFKALATIAPFCRNDAVFFVDGNISSRREGDDASVYRLSTLPQMGFNLKLLSKIKPLAVDAVFKPTANRVEFFGEQVRGALMALGIAKAETVAEVQGTDYVSEDGQRYGDWDNFDDDIPF